ncbi:SpoIID/LytB domain-containing protein [Soehngenia longivitae]|uniref:SpoIID/LytB domain-containing protein n=1 Tax=Soehngenia longivitae TaxID=2562294 RepID=A0A4Z0D517_9FIRM|nr:SpoIID/LytB domain-containing protein [Soehngenia longivitae]TFZ39532.1 SpoIID/LytB domain-containing protein [Soehngenia longivitae]
MRLKFNKLITICIFMIIFFLNSETLAENVQYIDVKIGNNVSMSSKIGISSTSGFIIRNTINDYSTNETAIYISLSSPEFYTILDENGNKIAEINYADNYEIVPMFENNDYVNLNGKYYRGSIKLIKNNNNCYIINHVSLEEYLYGVVPKEIPSSAPLEALKAQAIVSRSYSLSNLNKHIKDGYNLCDSTHCQVYGGYSAEKDSTNTAVDETKGMILEYNDRAVDAVFHSSSGGHTESSENVWGTKIPYLVAVKDPFSLNAPNSNWNITFTNSVIVNNLRNNNIEIQDLIDIEVLDRTESGRAKTIKVVASDKTVLLSGDKFRSIMGNSNFKSTLFSIEKNYDTDRVVKSTLSKNGIEEIDFTSNTIMIMTNNGIKNLDKSSIDVLNSLGQTNIKIDTHVSSFSFVGKGYGHGVGMSQYGAIEMAKEGYNYEQILQYYYKNIKITQ